MIAVVAFTPIPFVERFAHHHKTERIAQFDKFGRRHIVRGANGIAAHVAQQQQLAQNGLAVHRCPKRTEVVVEADAPKFTHLAVEQKAYIWHYLYGANAKSCCYGIDSHAIGLDNGARRVERGVFGRPECRVFQREILFQWQRMAHIVGRNERVGSFACRFFYDAGNQRDALANSVFYRSFQIHGRHFVSNIGCLHMHAPHRHMRALRTNQMHMAKKPSPRIPATALRTVFQAHCNGVFACL